MHTIVRVELARKHGKDFEGRIIEVFPSLDDPALELQIVAEHHPIPLHFSKANLKESENLSHLKPGKRRDLTQEVTVTIDGETAKDFDDAISIKKGPKGTFQLKVSIADVSHYVLSKGVIDREAYERGTSVYFPGFCIPMLPEHLSNGLCSLVPHEPRLTLTCEMEISKDGEVIRSSIYPSTIQSHARLTYTTVSKIIEGGERERVSPKIYEMLKAAHELSLIIRKNRHDRGALDLDLPEVEVDVDPSGEVKRIFLSERNEAHRLIEDFMILANETVSRSIESKGFASIYRVHEEPDPLKIERLKLIVKRFGFTLSDRKNLIDSLQRYLNSVKGHPKQKVLLISALRSLKQAQYSPTNVGHFGLGSESYCHFTSPIRRYPDLMIHRILRDSHFLTSKQEPYGFKELEKISEHCSETERRAFLAERKMEDIKKARFMANFVGKKFEGIVVSVKSFGVFVEIMPHFVDGLIPLRFLPNDVWVVDDLETQLKSRRNRIQFALGDSVEVQLQEVNRLRQEVSFRYIRHLD